MKHNRCNYVYVNRQKYLYECLTTCLRKRTCEIGLEFLVFFTFMNYVYVNRGRYLYEYLVKCLRKGTSEIELEFLAFLVFINLFMKTFTQEHNLPPDSLRMYVVKIIWQASLLLFLT